MQVLQNHWLASENHLLKIIERGFGVYAICDFTQNEHIKSQLIEMGVYPLDINLSKSTFSLIKDSIYFFNLLKIFLNINPMQYFLIL